MCGEDLVIYCETWLSCDFIVGGIRRYVEEIDIECLERALILCLERAFLISLERAFLISLERALLEFSSWEGPPSPNVYDSICESLC